MFRPKHLCTHRIYFFPPENVHLRCNPIWRIDGDSKRLSPNKYLEEGVGVVCRNAEKGPHEQLAVTHLILSWKLFKSLSSSESKAYSNWSSCLISVWSAIKQFMPRRRCWLVDSSGIKLASSAIFATRDWIQWTSTRTKMLFTASNAMAANSVQRDMVSVKEQVHFQWILENISATGSARWPTSLMVQWLNLQHDQQSIS